MLDRSSIVKWVLGAALQTWQSWQIITTYWGPPRGHPSSLLQRKGMAPSLFAPHAGEHEHGGGNSSFHGESSLASCRRSITLLW